VGTNRAHTITAVVGLIAATICMTLGAVWLGETAFRLGLAGAVLTATGLIYTRATIGPQWLERSRQDGYDAGYTDGCEVSRPAKVVGIERGSSGRRLTGGGPAHQLGQQGHVGGSADRVV
jgi:hypothetical protein